MSCFFFFLSDASRKEVSLLREDNLELKKERQVVMERNACLESKLAVINSAYSDNIKVSLLQ